MSQPESKPEVAPRTQQGVRRTIAERMWRIATRNLSLKISAVILAVILWSVLIASDGTLTREKVFPSAEVTVTGQDALRARRLIVTGGLEEITTVRLSAEVMQSAYDRVTAASYGPRIDLSKIREAGEQTVQVSMTSTSFGPVLAAEPDSVTLVVEEYAIIGRIPVVVEEVGNLPANLWADTSRADPYLVSVSGPQSMVSQVSSVVVQLDKGTLSAERVSHRGARPFVLQDQNGNVLDSPLLQVSSSDGVNLETVIVDINCYPEKSVPLDLASATTGVPAEGFEVTAIAVEPESLRIAATADALESIEKVTLDLPINIEGASQTVTQSVRISRPGDIRHIDTEEVTVTVRIEEKQGERLLRNLPIEVSGLGDGVSAKLSRSKVNATIGGGYSWLESLREDQVHLYVDAADLPEGEHELEIRSIVDGVATPDCVPEVPTVRVIIAELSD